MQTTKATIKDIKEWKEIYSQYRPTMQPNRKSGKEVEAYFKFKYKYEVLDSKEFVDVVISNIMNNKTLLEKLPVDTKPNIVTYKVDDVLVGIDLVSGHIHVECNNIDKAGLIYDDLFVYRGLDDKDLDNFYLVAEYIRLTKKDI